MSLGHLVRRSIARSTARPTLLSITPTTLIAPHASAILRFQPFSSTTIKLFQNQEQEQEQEQEQDNVAEVEDKQSDAISPPSSTENASIPWYLQVEDSAPKQDHPLSERQRLPDLPPSPPPLLQPILEHVSVELGIDHLSLLDLRTLDPPPALGANLIMAIGTARSEKHLHVSADRLCRWLRSNHHLSPFADGLLGRNELKLKMRRKAKRTRLLSAVGAKQTDGGEVDDGIRTGWVCVNVGRVEGGMLNQDNNQGQGQEPEGFVGFGTKRDGCRIVVQMMTEEKRGLIDLETLWNGILRRSNKAVSEQQGLPYVAEQPPQKEKIPEFQPEEKLVEPSSENTSIYRPPSIQSSIRQQARAFHSSAVSTQKQQGAQFPTNLESIPLSDSTLANSTVILTHLLNHLKSMEPKVALQALGQDSSDQESTAFLQAFYSTMPRFPEAEHWHSHVALRCHAICLGHIGYPRACLSDDLTNIRLACIAPAEETYMVILNTLLTPSASPSAESTWFSVPKKVLHQALDVLDRMHEDGYDPTSKPILELLYRATISPLSAAQSSEIFVSSEQENSFTLNQLLSALSMYSMRRAATSFDWSNFWELWHSYPKRFVPRSSDMYVMLFDVVSRRNSQKDAMAVLRESIPEMLREEPVVKLEGQVASAVRRCVEIAEPEVERIAKEGGRSEWVILWRRCARALGAA